jgi:hypothetical protein
MAVATSSDGIARKLLKAVEEFHTYINDKAGFIPNYGERYHHGERISTGFVKSTVNQVTELHKTEPTPRIPHQMDRLRSPRRPLSATQNTPCMSRRNFFSGMQLRVR